MWGGNDRTHIRTQMITPFSLKFSLLGSTYFTQRNKHRFRTYPSKSYEMFFIVDTWKNENKREESNCDCHQDILFRISYFPQVFDITASDLSIGILKRCQSCIIYVPNITSLLKDLLTNHVHQQSLFYLLNFFSEVHMQIIVIYKALIHKKYQQLFLANFPIQALSRHWILLYCLCSQLYKLNWDLDILGSLCNFILIFTMCCWRVL